MARKKAADTTCCTTTAQPLGVTYIDRVLPDQTGNAGKILSTNGTTLQWAFASDGSTVDTVPISGSPNAITSGAVFSGLEGKVDKIFGKGLSTNDFTTAEKSKLAALSLSLTGGPRATDTELRDRTTHTGVQPISSVSGLQETLNNLQPLGFYAEETHTHTIDDITSFAVVNAIAGQSLKYDGTYWVNSVDSNNVAANQAILDATTASYTSEEKTKLAGIAVGANNYVHPATHSATIIVQDSTHRFVTDADKTSWNTAASGSNLDSVVTAGSTKGVTSNAVFVGLDAKVDKVAGKGLSTNDYTPAEKSKLAGIQAGATANSTDAALLSQAASNALTAQKPASTITGLATISTTGSYTDLNNKPFIPAQFNPIAGSNMSITGVYPDITFTSISSGGNNTPVVILDNLTTTSSGSALDAHQGFVLKGMIDTTNTTMGTKVDAVPGKVLSSNDYTTTEKTKLAGIQAGATSNSTDASLLTQAANNAASASKSATTITEDATHRFFTDTERTKLTGIQAGATANSTDASLLSQAASSAATASKSATTITEDATHRFFTDTERTKLTGIATAATANNTDTFLLTRSNHLGTQAISTVTGLQTALDGKQAVLGFTAENSANKGVANGYAPLGADNKVPSTYLPSGAIVYKGTWNASTNTPILSDATGTNGWEYNVSVGGTQNLGSGSITFAAGSWIIHNGTSWQPTVNSNTVASVNGYTGAVVLTKADIGLSNVDNIAAASLRDRTTHTGVQPTSSINFAAGTKILGRITASTGTAEELSPTQVTSMLDLVTSVNKGLMASTDKTKLDGIAPSATSNSTDTFLLSRTNHTGTQSADTIIDGTTNKAFLATERTKLAGIATGATVNSTDSFLLARANHTGTQSADTIIDGITNKVFLATEKNKLAGIAAGATVNSTDVQLRDRTTHTGTQPANSIIGLSTVATTGSYADLLNKPVIPAQFNPIAGTNMTITGTYPNMTFTATGGSGGSVTVTDNLTTTTAGTALDARQGNILNTNKVDKIAGKQLSTEDYTTTEKNKLAGIAPSATANSTDSFLLSRVNHIGTQSADTITDGVTNKSFLATERSKLAGIATGATANSSDAQLRDRATHSGLQAATTVTEDSTHRFTTDAEKSTWNSKVGSVGSPNAITNVWVGTQAQYNAIATPSASILYFIQ